MPRFEQHTFQKQLAVGLHIGLVQPHGQVAQGEVVVCGVCKLLRDRALQEKLLPVHVGQLAGDLICNRRLPLVARIHRAAPAWGGAPP